MAVLNLYFFYLQKGELNCKNYIYIQLLSDYKLQILILPIYIYTHTHTHHILHNHIQIQETFWGLGNVPGFIINPRFWDPGKVPESYIGVILGVCNRRQP